MHVLILRQYISLSSLTVGKTSLWGGWKSLAIRTCGHLGYSATWPQPWSRKAANCNTFAWSLAPLLICRSNSNSQIDVDLIQQPRENIILYMLVRCEHLDRKPQPVGVGPRPFQGGCQAILCSPFTIVFLYTVPCTVTNCCYYTWRDWGSYGLSTVNPA